MARWIRKYNNRDRERLERLIEEKEAEASHHLRSEHNGSANATQQLWKSLRIETNDRKYLDSVHDRSSSIYHTKPSYFNNKNVSRHYCTKIFIYFLFK